MIKLQQSTSSTGPMRFSHILELNYEVKSAVEKVQRLWETFSSQPIKLQTLIRVLSTSFEQNSTNSNEPSPSQSRKRSHDDASLSWKHSNYKAKTETVCFIIKSKLLWCFMRFLYLFFLKSLKISYLWFFTSDSMALPHHLRSCCDAQRTVS